MGTNLLRRGLALVALALGMAVTSGASAQFGEAAGFGEMMSPYFLRRDLEIFEQSLDLDEGQAGILESLYWDYEDEHDAGKARMLDRLNNMRDDLQDLDRDEVLHRVFEPFEDRSREWDALREQFLVNVKAILTAEQLADWDEFRRRLRREKEISRGRFSGENLDLFHVIRKMDDAQMIEEEIRPTLDEYAIYLDEALAWREKQLNESRLAMMNAIRDEDPTSSLAIYERQVEARVAVRRVNDEYTTTINDLLPAGVSEEFLRLARERAYPRVYRATIAERMFAEAARLEGLDEETVASIVALREGLEEELVAVKSRIVQLLHEYEPAEQLYRATSFAMRATGQRPEKPVDPTRDEFRRREQIGRRYIELLRDLLTPEQFQSLSGAQRFLRSDPASVGVGGAEDQRDAGARKRRFLRSGGNASSGLTKDDD